jgi:hypothetical protein
MNNLKSQKFTSKILNNNHNINIGGDSLECKVTIVQPLDSEGKFDETRCGMIIDPLAISMGMYTPGYYYFVFGDYSEDI